MKYAKAEILYDGVGSKRNVYIGFENEKITYVGEKKPEGESIGEGIITPAFIDPHSHIGLDRAGEPGMESEANDRLDSFIPLGRAVDGVYMDDTAFRESVENNVLYSVVLPGSGNIMGGMGSLIRNFGINIKEAYIKDIGMKMALGYNPRSTTEWKGTRPTTRMGVYALIRKKFMEAAKTKKLIETGKKTMEEVDPETEKIIDIISGKIRIMCHVHKEDDTLFLLDLRRTYGLDVVINHGCDYYQDTIYREIEKENVPMVFGPLDSHPYKVELKHESYKNVEKLQKSKIKFALISDHPVILQRTLFLTTRHFMRYGASKEQCISYLTSRPAEILGLNNLGSIETGKLASFSIWNKDPFLLDSYPKVVVGEGKFLVEE
ncbi:amidohydrolase family protein [Caldiplasma sukawensis]